MDMEDESNQADRAISTGKLNALPRLHSRPINVVVYHGSQGELVLRLASRLDAFSGYPFHTRTDGGQLNILQTVVLIANTRRGMCGADLVRSAMQREYGQASRLISTS